MTLLVARWRVTWVWPAFAAIELEIRWDPSVPECLEKCIFAAQVLLCGCIGHFQLHYTFSTASSRRVMSVNATGQSVLVRVEAIRSSKFGSKTCLRYLFLLPHFQDDLINLDSCIPNRCNIAAAVPKRQYIIDERCINSLQCRGVTRRLLPETHLLCLGLQWQESSSKSSNATKQHERRQKEVEPGWAGAKQHSKGFNVRLCWIISLVAFAIFSHFGLQVDVVTWHSQRASYLTGPACKTLGDHFWSEGGCTNLRPTQWSLWSLMWRPSCNMQTAAKFAFVFFRCGVVWSNQVCLPLLSPRLDSTVVASLGLVPCRVINGC